MIASMSSNLDIVCLRSGKVGVPKVLLQSASFIHYTNFTEDEGCIRTQPMSSGRNQLLLLSQSSNLLSKVLCSVESAPSGLERRDLLDVSVLLHVEPFGTLTANDAL